MGSQEIRYIGYVSFNGQSNAPLVTYKMEANVHIPTAKKTCKICHFCTSHMNMFSTWVLVFPKQSVSSRLEDIRSKVFCCPQRFMLNDEQFNFVFLLFFSTFYDTNFTWCSLLQEMWSVITSSKRSLLLTVPATDNYRMKASVLRENTPFILSRLDFAWFQRMDSAVTRLFLLVFASFNVKYVW